MNLSFAGCGFLGIYHVGVACCFRKYAPHLLLNKISGASAGAIAACCLLLDLPLGEMTSDVLRVAIEARRRSLGPLNPSFNIHKLLLEGLEKFLPADAHTRVSGKLHISLTRVRDGKNVIVSSFDSRQELIEALLASAFIPIFSGLFPPKYKGIRYMDGGYSDNLPTLDENTITVSPFCGESDICPRDDSAQLFHINIANTSIELSKHNIYRILRILFPPKPEVLSNMCKQGFDDALRFLHRNNLLNCTRCLAVQSTYVISKTLEENLEYDPECLECHQHRQEALVSNMPDTVISIFQEAIESANKGVLNWLFKHRGMKLLSVLSLPYTVPADIMFSTLYRVVSTIPELGYAVWDTSRSLVQQLADAVSRIQRPKVKTNAQVTCHLNIMEYEENYDDALSVKNNMNLNFTLDMEDRDLPVDDHLNDKFSTATILQRTPSFTFSKTDTENDTFEHILEVTKHHESVMHYYYLDDDNKVKVTEIFDVTDSDSPVVQTEYEQEMNQRLEFDDEWNESGWPSSYALQRITEARRRSQAELSEYSFEDLLDQDAPNVFSDPESEWAGTYTIEEPDDEDDIPGHTDLMPESEQSEQILRLKTCLIPSFTYQDI